MSKFYQIELLKQLNSLSDYIYNADFDNLTVRNVNVIISTAADFLLSLRESLIYSNITGDTKNIIDTSIIKEFKIIIDKEYIDEQSFCYNITFPILLPKRGTRINSSLLSICLNKAIEDYKERYEGPIIPVPNPLVFFENRFTESIYDIGSVKDADNYETGSIINAFQGIFYGDDRNVALFIKNTGACEESKTIIHILPQSLLSTFINEENIE